jgi:hypothetical protein
MIATAYINLWNKRVGAIAWDQETLRSDLTSAATAECIFICRVSLGSHI